MTEKVKTRILIISDTHGRGALENGEEGDGDDNKRPFREPLPKADVLIHCGDLTMTGSHTDYHTTLSTLSSIDASLKLVIAGNHDLTLDPEWMLTHAHDSRISSLPTPERDYTASRELWTGITGRARKEGVVFLDEGVHRFTLSNGARLNIYASPYTPEFYDWGFPYSLHQDRFNTPPHSLSGAENIASCPIPSFKDDNGEGGSVDVLITHGPPFERLDLCSSGASAGCPHLLRALMRARPLLHCFGHIHEGWGAEVVRWSDDATAVATKATGLDEWKKGAWEEGVEGGSEKGIVSVKTDLEKARGERSVRVDVAEGSDMRVERGRQTLIVNASIMDLGYEAKQAPFLIDLELDKVT